MPGFVSALPSDRSTVDVANSGSQPQPDDKPHRQANRLAFHQPDVDTDRCPHEDTNSQYPECCADSVPHWSLSR